MAMGAIIGVTAWQRTQEKIAMVNRSGFGDGMGGMTTERTTERTSSTVTATPPVSDTTQPTKPAVSSRAD